MPIDPRIALGVQAPQIDHPAQTLATIGQLRNLQQTEQLNRLRIEEVQRTRSAQDRALHEEQQLRQLFASGEADPGRIYSIVGPQRGMEIVKGLSALQKDNLERFKTSQELIGSVLGGLKALPEGMRAEAYTAARMALIQQGIIKSEGVPEQYSPEFIETAQRWAMTPQQQYEAEQPKLHNVPAGTTVIDERNPTGPPVVVTEPRQPQRAPSEFDDYLVTYARDIARKPVQALTAHDREDARKRYQQADDRPIVPIVIQTAEGPQLLDRSTGTAAPITDSEGKTLGLVPTAAARDRVQAREFVGKSISAMRDLSARIITKIGPAQRADAAKRGIEAVFGTDPEFRTYQDARMALAGNLAVAQQGSRPSDADIKAIWLPLVPDPWRDTSESAAMKWQLIDTMSGTDTGTAQGDGGGWQEVAPGVRVRVKP